ncbi:hypothetical protein Mal64_02060 [Pseudobythopirellula maris]|uniref:Insertion element IS402-like domain-containing protein n=1 Tax=Pseudobythopirellula maris TaxID=2527991 RepID=A0A5C5ZRF9_9BACT|nr:transposase [Pseudobythopirellula maris]TWT89826.1 hypothetical protein Mal64_02060 [Pseudobythopirellula maris]
MAKGHALTQEQWEAIRDLLPGKEGDPGRSGENNRLFVDAVLYVLKTGVPWEDLPARFGKGNFIERTSCPGNRPGGILSFRMARFEGGRPVTPRPGPPLALSC